jgi:hypothetical protein
MTEQQFKDLKIGDKVEYQEAIYTITSLDCYEQLMFIETTVFKRWVRYENCELVLKDKLVEFLCDNNHDGLTVNDNTFLADKIRQIVRKEVIDSLKFPTIIEVYGKRLNNSNQDFYEWFVEETKRLNR